MKKEYSYRWIIYIIVALVLIGISLWKLLPPYIDWWLTDVQVEFDKLKAENPDVIGWIRFDDQDELGINYPSLEI